MTETQTPFWARPTAGGTVAHLWTSAEDTACSEEDLWAGSNRSEDSTDMVVDLCPRCLAKIQA